MIQPIACTGGPPIPSRNSPIPSEGWPLPHRASCPVAPAPAAGRDRDRARASVGDDASDSSRRERDHDRDRHEDGGGTCAPSWQSSNIVGELQRRVNGRAGLSVQPNAMLLGYTQIWASAFDERVGPHVSEITGPARDGESS